MTILEDLAANSQLHWSDYIVLIVYFVVIIGIGIWVSCQNFFQLCRKSKFFVQEWCKVDVFTVEIADLLFLELSYLEF